MKPRLFPPGCAGERQCRLHSRLRSCQEKKSIGFLETDGSGLVFGAQRAHADGQIRYNMLLRVSSKGPATVSGRAITRFHTAIDDFPPFKKTHVFRNGLRGIYDVGI